MEAGHVSAAAKWAVQAIPQYPVLDDIHIKDNPSFGCTQEFGREGTRSGANRIFIPEVMPASPHRQIVFENAPCVAINYYVIRRYNKIYQNVKRRQIRDALGIPDDVAVLITTTAKDETIERLLLRGGVSDFKKDILDFGTVSFMGPDLWNYRDISSAENEKMIRTSLEFHLQCTDLDNLIPNIPGNYLKEKLDFVGKLKALGFDTFIQPGREYLINSAGRKKDEMTLASLISRLKAEEKIKVLVKGCSSPRQQKLLYDADGFIGLGYYVNAMNRALIQDGKFVRILKDGTDFACDNERCCNSLQPKQLAEKQNDGRRILHNLFENQRSAGEKARVKQTYLVG